MLLGQLRQSGDRVASQTIALGGAGESLQLIAIEALAIRQADTDVRELLTGIPADTIARLFKRDGLNVREAGLALLLISDIMAAHGGRVDVRSSTDPVGHGTTIRLTFPAR